MYQVRLAVLGLPLGLIIGAFTGALLGNALDNPNAARGVGVGAFFGALLIAPLSAIGGIVCGFCLGCWIDRRGQQRTLRISGAAHSAKGLQNHRRIKRQALTRILMCAACGAVLGSAGLILGLIVGAFTGASLDNGPMPRFMGALAGALLIAPLGAVCGIRLGSWISGRSEQPASSISGAPQGPDA